MDVGIDIVDIGRIGKLVKNNRFLARVFTEKEIKYCNLKRNKAQHFAVRFAAKEAAWKAIGQKALSHRDISVSNDSDGKPRIILNKFKKLQKKISISLSHSKDYAAAVVFFNN